MTRQWILGLSVCLLPTLLGAQERPTLPRGHVLFTANFEGPDALKGWPGPVALDVGFQGGHGLLLERSAADGGDCAMTTIELPVEKMRGYVVQFWTRVRAENVSPKPRPWNGVKFMAPIVTNQGTRWPSVEFEAGSFDWKRVGFRAAIPEDAKQVRLCVGLESLTGKVWFDDIRVVIGRRSTISGSREAVGAVHKGHTTPRLRGAMISRNIDEEGLRVLGQQWNANLVRWQLIRTGPIDNPLDLVAYDRWLQSALKQLDAALPLCEKYGLRVVVDLHSPPGGQRTSGGYAGSDHGLFTDAACQRRFVELWQQMARKYKDVKVIWGYDLANEPIETLVEDDLADWPELADRTARAIRAIDPERTIIVEPAQGGSPPGLAELEPLRVPNIVYSVHMYIPGEFTHQGVYHSNETVHYPGQIAGKRWDKAQLEAALQPAIDYQRKYGVHIYIGEFSAIRWAPDQSACRYLKDVIDIFEAHGWDWTYHAFREWDGWSVEHGSDRKDRNRSTMPTDREQLLRSWFGKNVKPAL